MFFAIGLFENLTLLEFNTCSYMLGSKTNEKHLAHLRFEYICMTVVKKRELSVIIYIEPYSVTQVLL